MRQGGDTAHLRLVCGEGESALTVRRSRFFGHAAGLPDPRTALPGFVVSVRARHRDAGHVVYAWRGRDGATRTSDDGEPGGTGGRPLLAALTRHDLVDSVVAVARVFGGTLLGAPGLARAYGAAGEAAIAAAEIRVLESYQRLSVRVGYADQPALEDLLGAALAAPTRVYDGAGVAISGEARCQDVQRLTLAVRAATAGRARLHLEGEPHWR